MKSGKRLNKITFAVGVLVLICLVAYIVVTGAVSFEADAPAPTHSGAAGAQMNVMVIDVGQGDSILVTMETGETMLIDAGESSEVSSIKEELDERGITQIDILIATHPHADHIGGMTQIIESYEIGSIYMPDMQSDSKTYKKLRSAIDARGIPLIEAFAGLTFQLGSAECMIVSPDEDADKDANNESVVLLLDYLDTEFLFTGDMEEWAEDTVLENGYPVDADVLKVAHHGSSTGTSEAFLSAVSPDYAVISCGKDNKYGHPHDETLALFEKYDIGPLRTDLSGDILFVSDGRSLRIVTGD